MSEKKPEPRDRTALYIAMVGAGATVLAALIGVLPNILPRQTPTPIVITATPLLIQVSQATNIPTSIPPGATSIPLTATTKPSATPIPATQPPTATAAPPTAASSRLDFLVSNNQPNALDFYIDEEFQVTAPAGGYQILRVLPGEHRLTHCPGGANPSDTASGCVTLQREVLNNPYDWTLGGNEPASGQVLLFLLNQIDNDIDIFIDGTTRVSVDAHQIGTTQLAPGSYQIQTCPRGAVPSGGECGDANSFELLRNVEMYVVNLN